MAKAIKIALVKSISFLTHVSEVLSMTAVAADDDTAAAKGAVDVCFTLEVRLAGAVARSNEGARRLEAYNGTVSDLASTFSSDLVSSISDGKFSSTLANASAGIANATLLLNQTTSINTTLANSDVSTSLVLVEYTRPPTPLPTLVPSPLPSIMPIPVPTFAPTRLPFPAPTFHPSALPTALDSTLLSVSFSASSDTMPTASQEASLKTTIATQLSLSEYNIRRLVVSSVARRRHRQRRSLLSVTWTATFDISVSLSETSFFTDAESLSSSVSWALSTSTFSDSLTSSLGMSVTVDSVSSVALTDTSATAVAPTSPSPTALERSPSPTTVEECDCKRCESETADSTVIMVVSFLAGAALILLFGPMKVLVSAIFRNRSASIALDNSERKGHESTAGNFEVDIKVNPDRSLEHEALVGVADDLAADRQEEDETARMQREELGQRAVAFGQEESARSLSLALKEKEEKERFLMHREEMNQKLADSVLSVAELCTSNVFLSATVQRQENELSKIRSRAIDQRQEDERGEMHPQDSDNIAAMTALTEDHDRKVQMVLDEARQAAESDKAAALAALREEHEIKLLQMERKVAEAKAAAAKALQEARVEMNVTQHQEAGIGLFSEFDSKHGRSRDLEDWHDGEAKPAEQKRDSEAERRRLSLLQRREELVREIQELQESQQESDEVQDTVHEGFHRFKQRAVRYEASMELINQLDDIETQLLQASKDASRSKDGSTSRRRRAPGKRASSPSRPRTKKTDVRYVGSASPERRSRSQNRASSGKKPKAQTEELRRHGWESPG